jgi:asparagine synthase (glutamine-hydrolysing)
LGHRFRTNGDGEVLVHAYEEYGQDMLAKISGMFAFAIWNVTEQSLFIARDHLGVKPLYYYWDGKTLVFGSELKALIKHPAVTSDIDLEAVWLYLQCQYIPSPLTIYQNTRKLPASCALFLKGNKLDIISYWQPDYRNKIDVSIPEAAELLDRELRKSVNSMLVSDVPFGTFISGGIDSGLVAALMTDCLGKPVETFNLGFMNARGGVSEHHEAELVARHIGSHHHSFMLNADDLLQNFEQLVESFDEPFADTAALPTMMLAKLTRDHVKVVLTGEGADEIFSGYGNYRKRLRDERLVSLCSGPFSPLPFLVSRLPKAFRKDRLINALAKPLSQRYVTIPNIFHESQQSGICTRDFANTVHLQLSALAAGFFEECNSDSYLDKILYVDARLWLPDDLLTKVDRATMAFSLEARVPYLDKDLVQFCASLPADLKLQQTTTKFILKKMAEKYLPKNIVYRRKQGFVMPVKEWLQHDLQHYLRNHLSSASVLKRNLLKPARVNRLIAEHLAEKKNHSFKLWTLLMLELWFQKYQPDFKL